MAQSLQATRNLASQVAQGMDPTQIAAEQQAGQALYQTEEQNGGVSGATDFANECIDNYNRLLASQQ